MAGIKGTIVDKMKDRSSDNCNKDAALSSKIVIQRFL